MAGMSPYPYISAPVVLGTVGGILGTIGCIMSLRAKSRSDHEQTTKAMLTADKALIWALLILNVSGLLTLFFRETALFGLLFVGHFGSVLVFFVFAPFSKFVHWVFRVLATYKDVLETTPTRASSVA